MKERLCDFACLGGHPAFPSPVVLGAPVIPDRDRFFRRVESVLDRRQLTNGGPMLREFESRLCGYLGVRNVVAVCNGTMALQIMAKAAGLTGEVIVPAFTFIATAHALSWIGLTPVFADVDEGTHTLDPDSVERCISPRTSAILGVHLWGNVCDVGELQRLADRHHLKLLFDASQAFGSGRDGRSVGGFGCAEAFSFHATKVMHCFEGGAITTNDDVLAEACRLQRNFGFAGFTDIRCCGINGKLDEISAAAGITNLEAVDQVLENNSLKFQYLRRVLNGIPGLTVLQGRSSSEWNAQYAVLKIDGDQFGLSRDHLLQVLRAEGVFARSYYVPGCHRAPPYDVNPGHCPVDLPITEDLLQNVIQLPTGPAIELRQIDLIGDLLRAIHGNRNELHSVLTTSGSRSVYHALDPAKPAMIVRSEAA